MTAYEIRLSLVGSEICIRDRCYGGFKATPASGWCFAHLLATDEHHEVAEKYTLDRFEKGYLLDEEATGATPNLH